MHSGGVWKMFDVPKTGLEPSTQISLGSETEFCMTKEKLARIVDDFGKDDVEKKDGMNFEGGSAN